MKMVKNPRNPRQKHNLGELLVLLISGYLARRTLLGRALRDVTKRLQNEKTPYV